MPRLVVHSKLQLIAWTGQPPWKAEWPPEFPSVVGSPSFRSSLLMWTVSSPLDQRELNHLVWMKWPASSSQMEKMSSACHRSKKLQGLQQLRLPHFLACFQLVLELLDAHKNLLSTGSAAEPQHPVGDFSQEPANCS